MIERHVKLENLSQWTLFFFINDNFKMVEIIRLNEKSNGIIAGIFQIIKTNLNGGKNLYML